MKDNDYTLLELRKAYRHYKSSIEEVRNPQQKKRLDNIAEVVNLLIRRLNHQQIRDEMNHIYWGTIDSYIKQVELYIKNFIRPPKSQSFLNV